MYGRYKERQHKHLIIAFSLLAFQKFFMTIFLGFEVFLKVKGKGIWTDKEEIYVRGGAGGGVNGYDYKKGWQE